MAYTVDLRNKKPQEQETSALLDAPEHNDHVISWVTSLSKIPAKKTAVLVLMISIAGGIGAMLLDRNYLFATLLFLTGTLMMMSSHQKPTQHEVQVDLTGITVRGQRYPYREMKSFWISYEPPHKELSIELRKALTSYIKIPLENINPMDVRARIITAVVERKHEDSVLDQIVRKLGV